MLTQKLLGIMLLGAEWILWVLLALSALSLAVVLERAWYFNRNGGDVDRFWPNLRGLLDKGNLGEAAVLLGKERGVEARVAAESLRMHGRGSRAVEETITATLGDERARFDRGLSFLGTVGSNAPFIGLLGTVIGILKAFHELSKDQTGQGAQVIMAEISQALVATAVGLFVAIPAVVAFNFFKSRVKARMSAADTLARHVLARLPEETP